MGYSDQDIEQQLRDEAQKKGVEYSDSDLQDVRHRDNSDEGLAAAFKKYDSRSSNTANSGEDNNDGRSNPWQGGSGNSTASQWTAGGQQGGGNFGGGSAGFNDGGVGDILQQMREEMKAREAATNTRRDGLYQQLDTRAKQSLTIDPNDPVIAAQTDAYGADQQRASRDYLANLAEKAGPDANLRGEQRMAAEKVGQATSGFRAQLMGQELTQRRGEIVDALNSMRGLLTADQQAQLEQEVSLLDHSIKQQGIGLQGRSLDQDWRKALMMNDQFNADLGLRAEDRASYYDLVRSGLLRG